LPDKKPLHHRKKPTPHAHEPFSKRAQNTARWASLIVLWVIIGSIAIGKAGITNYRALLHERDVLFAANVQLTVENQTIEQNIKHLQNSTYSQEKYLREEFGYLKKSNEFILWLTEPDATHSQGSYDLP
jgi:cell division protein FtsB